jgi:hypothetical protein
MGSKDLREPVPVRWWLFWANILLRRSRSLNEWATSPEAPAPPLTGVDGTMLIDGPGGATPNIPFPPPLPPPLGNNEVVSSGIKRGGGDCLDDGEPGGK